MRDEPLPAGDPGFAVQRMDAPTAAALVGGIVLAALCLAVPFLNFVLSYLTTLIHELGHAAVGWLFGYPSLPAFDFTYGGGVTRHDQRSMLMLGAVYLSLLCLLPAYLRNRATLFGLCVLSGLFAWCAHTEAHRVVILFMGHGMELLIAGVFLYRAWSGSAVFHATERLLYAACGWFIIFSDTAFAWRLWTDSGARAAYAKAKGGGHWMDFSRIAREHLHWELSSVAFIFLLCCVAPVALSYLAFRYQDWVFDRLARLVAREASEI